MAALQVEGCCAWSIRAPTLAHLQRQTPGVSSTMLACLGGPTRLWIRFYAPKVVCRHASRSKIRDTALCKALQIILSFLLAYFFWKLKR